MVKMGRNFLLNLIKDFRIFLQNMNYKNLIYLLIFIQFSCSSKIEAHFEITNSTNFLIDSLKIDPNDNRNSYIQLKPYSTVIYKVDMTNTPKTDGCYFLTFKHNKIYRDSMFGYFSNGIPMGNLTRINILTDSIIIKE